jgi:hypothetical protein
LFFRRLWQNHIDALVDIEDNDVGVGEVVLTTDSGQNTNRQTEIRLKNYETTKN